MGNRKIEIDVNGYAFHEISEHMIHGRDITKENFDYVRNVFRQAIDNCGNNESYILLHGAIRDFKKLSKSETLAYISEMSDALDRAAYYPRALLSEDEKSDLLRICGKIVMDDCPF